MGFAEPGGHAEAHAEAPREAVAQLNILAVLALVAGLLGVLILPSGMHGGGVLGWPTLLGLAGLIMGVVAVGQVRETGQQGHAMAVAGIVLGAIALTFGLMQGMMRPFWWWDGSWGGPWHWSWTRH